MLKSVFGFGLLTLFVGYLLHNGSRAIVYIDQKTTSEHLCEQLLTHDVQAFFTDQIKN
ncbi:hypothetical protein [Vibrio sp. WXL103]|uniref:hypothetical protein n=1 Tax=Vibrio sp. WXL103 TaxID=3450710 RepID=UPI003EC87A3D